MEPFPYHRSKCINISVKNLRKLGYESLENWLENPNHFYIGRECPWVLGAKESKWKNPFPVKKYGVEKSLLLYEDYLISSGLFLQTSELQGKILGCWCKPKKCHGDILIKYI